MEVRYAAKRSIASRLFTESLTSDSGDEVAIDREAVFIECIDDSSGSIVHGIPSY